jgi:hypothetical protein
MNDIDAYKWRVIEVDNDGKPAKEFYVFRLLPTPMFHVSEGQNRRKFVTRDGAQAVADYQNGLTP